MSDETRPVRVYKVTLCIVDYDDLTEQSVQQVIENQRYPNHCLHPKVIAVESREIQYYDGHPINLRAQQRAEFLRLFAEPSDTRRVEDGQSLME